MKVSVRYVREKTASSANAAGKKLDFYTSENGIGSVPFTVHKFQAKYS